MHNVMYKMDYLIHLNIINLLLVEKNKKNIKSTIICGTILYIKINTP